MKLNEFKLDSAIMRTADRKLRGYIASAAYHLMEAEEYEADYYALHDHPYYNELSKDWPDMARLYRSLVKADMKVARALVGDLEDVGLLDLADWSQIEHWLIWFGIPAEDRLDD